MRLRILAVACIFVPVAAHAQVAVTDPGSYLNQARSLLQDAKSYALQARQAVTEAQTYAQTVQTYYAFVQNPSLGAAAAIMNREGLGNSLPIDPNALVALTSGYSMSLSGLAGKLSQLSMLSNASYQQNLVYNCTNGSFVCQMQQQQAYALAGTGGIAQAAYQDVRNHMQVVEALRARAATATTPAEREQIMIALQAEQTWHNNLMTQLNAAQMQSNVQTATNEQRQLEYMSQQISATIASIPGS